MMMKRVFGATGGLLVVTVIMGLMLCSNIALADEEHIDDVAITVPLVCNLTATEDTAHTATINPGVYRTDIGTTTFKVTCNDTSGYSVYAVGYANNEFGNTKLLATVGGVLTPAYDIVTGIGTNSTETGGVSNWAMKLTPVTGTYAPTIESAPNTQGGSNASFTSYHTVPSTYTKVATYSSITDTVTGSSFTATYAAYIAADQPAGTYDGKVKYTMVHPASEVPTQPQACTNNKICYWPNASGVTDNMGDQSASASTDTMLWPTNYSRSGYGFAGWTDQYDYKLGASTNTGHIYGPMETITTPADMSSGLSLYAVWVKSAGNLQNWTGCSSLASGAVTALTDQRDNNTYAVAKLADGKCWMIENLRLDYTNSDNSTGALSQGYGGQFAGLALPETANFTGSTSSATEPTEANSLYYAGTGNEGSLGATINILQENYPGFRMPRYRNDNTNTDTTTNPNTTVANMTGTGQNIYSYGNYYSWPAAKANTSYINTAAISEQTENLTSLCPTGWNLPRGGNKTRIEGGTSDFYTLGLAIVGQAPANYSNSSQPNWTNNSNTEGTDASKAIRSYPNNFVCSGDMGGSSAISRGSDGYYWSATANSYHAYSFSFYSTYVYPGTNDSHKYYGRTIRCVVSPSA